MLRIFSLVFSLFASIFFGSGAQASASNCSGPNVHQKGQAICLVQKLVRSGGNDEITSQVDAYTSKGLQESGEYSALFVGADSVDSGYGFTYLVGVDFYSEDQFRSVLVLVKTSPSDPPQVSEVVSRSRIEGMIN